MLVSIVILNWNRKKDTLDCLESLGKTIVDFKLETIVVDNASTDGSSTEIRKFLKKMSFKRNNFRSEILKNKDNLGFCEGNNLGIRHALNHGADYILLPNNDTLVDESTFGDLLRVALSRPKAGLLSPKIYFAPGYEFKKDIYKSSDMGRVIWYAGGNIDWDNVYGTNHGVDEVDKGQFERVRETDFATGACMLIKRELLEKVGTLDEKYFMYFEDSDLSHRARNAGYEVLYAPPARIWHKVSQSSKIGGDLNDYFIIRNRLLFGMRYAPVRTRLALYRESLRLFWKGRPWQKKGVLDFYLGKFGRGSWK